MEQKNVIILFIGSLFCMLLSSSIGATFFWYNSETTEPSATKTNSSATTRVQPGDIIALQSDTGKYLARCEACIPGAPVANSAFIHVVSPSEGPWAKWTVVDAGGGKIALKSDIGTYLARCNKCIPNAHLEDTAFVHATSPSVDYAKWTVEDAGDDKVGLKSDIGKYLARCRTCIPTNLASGLDDSAFIHVQSLSEGPWAKWTVVKLN
jgi:hypothetical protein